MAAVKVGLIDVLINPLYLDSICPDIRKQVEDAVNKKDFNNARLILKTKKWTIRYLLISKIKVTMSMRSTLLLMDRLK